MNWLAHLYLSEPTPAFRIGNLLPDLATPRILANLPTSFHRGIECHRRIDCFTDTHPVVRSSLVRFHSPYRRFGGILTDIFYDHFLARRWKEYSRIELDDFVEQIYRDFELYRPNLPSEINERLAQIKNARWLNSYSDLAGIEEVLQRLGLRLRRPSDLAGGMAILKRDYNLFETDFEIFFPQLIAHVQKLSD